MTYQRDASFLQGLILGHADPLATGTLARLVVMRSQYRAALDAGMSYLVQKVFEAHALALAQATQAADRAYLESLVNDIGELLAEDTFAKIEPMFARYSEGTEMFALLEKSAAAFGDAVQALSGWVLAGVVIEEAQRWPGRGS